MESVVIYEKFLYYFMKQRSLLIFEESIKSSKSKKNYLYHIKYLLKFSKIKDYDGLIKVPTEQMQTILEDYVMYLKRTVNPNSVPIYMTGIKHFFVMNRVRIYWEIIQKMYPEQVKRSGQKAWSDQHVQKMIQFSNSARNKALVHFMASTGARIGIHDYPLQMQHLKDMGEGCRAILIYAGETDEYWAFLTPEANRHLEDYFEQRKQNNEKFYPDTPIFRTEYRLGIEKTKQLQRNPAIGAITRLVHKAKIRRERVNKKNFDIQLDHGFRKRFNIILKLENDINSNIAEKIMGHSVSIPLDGTYLPAQDERVIQKCFTEFKKAIPQLTIDDSERKQALLDVALKEKTELEQQRQQNQNLEERIEKQEKQIKELFDYAFKKIE